MSEKIKNEPPNIEDIHSFLEKTLIETYLDGKGYSLEDLKKLPEAESKRLMKEASIYASNKLAEVEVKARLIQDLHDAYSSE